MHHISTLLPPALRKRGLYEQVTASIVTANVRKWLTEKFPAHVQTLRVASLSNGVLMIECDNPVAMQECNQAAGEITSYIRDTLKYAGIKSVRVVRAR